ncbi:MAG: coagulation factor 5/8 type domain-containing protein, partial [Arenimonas sp.]
NGRDWRVLGDFPRSDGGDDWIALTESEGRFLRVSARDRATRAALPALRASVEPLAFGASTNAFLQAVAARAPRGDWPRGFSGEQPYWTIVGVDGGMQQGLLGEDGAIEFAKGSASIEPFVQVDGVRYGWAQAKASQSLRDGYLPIPRVRWQLPGVELEITANAHGDARSSKLIGHYRLRNTSQAAKQVVLNLALRPLQVNPPSQFLNTAGGFSPIHAIEADPGHGRIDGGAGFVLIPDADSVSAPVVADPTGLASAAWHYARRLGPGEVLDVSWAAPLGSPLPLDFGRGFDADRLESESAATWHRKLDTVKFQVPPQGERMIQTLRYALATMLVSRSGPRLQPGTRSYARAWIRDGAMINEALLRLGREDVAKDFVRWYAPYQFKDGKVPCCVDDRGSDPVPENDSHGELVFAIAEAYRYTRDKALLETLWPNVVGAVKYMDALRASERTEANRALNPAFYGLLPASISHEGYSAKAMHSYWDDFWALRGYKDAVQIARWLGHGVEAAAFAISRDQFAADLQASLAFATKAKGIDFIPGSAELGDFDPTSTTIALAPADASALLPPGLLQKGFERYWNQSQERADGSRAWKDYTPYELRTVGTFVRLGQPGRAQAMLEFFFKGQQPEGWRQWAEVVSSSPRKPFFLGDIPHAWVASDYVRSVLDMFAYTRERDDALVIGAGIPLDWLDGEGVAIEGLRTPHGPLGYRLWREGDTVQLLIDAGTSAPTGGFVLALPQAKVHGARIDGKRVRWIDGELRIPRAPARVQLKLAP